MYKKHESPETKRFPGITYGMGICASTVVLIKKKREALSEVGICAICGVIIHFVIFAVFELFESIYV